MHAYGVHAYVLDETCRTIAVAAAVFMRMTGLACVRGGYMPMTSKDSEKIERGPDVSVR
jgi:hypothetical protein